MWSSFSNFDDFLKKRSDLYVGSMNAPFSFAQISPVIKANSAKKSFIIRATTLDGTERVDLWCFSRSTRVERCTATSPLSSKHINLDIRVPTENVVRYLKIFAIPKNLLVSDRLNEIEPKLPYDNKWNIPEKVAKFSEPWNLRALASMKSWRIIKKRSKNREIKESLLKWGYTPVL